MDVHHPGGLGYNMGGLRSQSMAPPTTPNPTAPTGPGPGTKMNLRFISKSTDLIDVGRWPAAVGGGGGGGRGGGAGGGGGTGMQRRRISTANPMQGLRRMQQQQHGFHPMLQVAGKTLNMTESRWAFIECWEEEFCDTSLS